MTPKAFFTGREIGATTARAVTLRMAGAVALIPASSLHTVPAQQARRGPIRCHRLDQPAPGMFGWKCDPLGLSGRSRQRIQPERRDPLGLPGRSRQSSIKNTWSRWRGAGRWRRSPAASKNVRGCNLWHSAISEFGLVEAGSSNDESRSGAGGKNGWRSRNNRFNFIGTSAGCVNSAG
jgi:hypothetical protein